jgi:hypothetical protein
MSAKVLLPINPQFILEIVDLILYKTSERVIFISEAANQVIQYSNINVEYLSKMLQKKIYDSQSPFNFDKLFQQERFFVFNNIEQYLDYKKERGTLYHENYSKEIILVSSPNLRMGDSVYWLHNLNKHYASTSFMILTEPSLVNNELLMKPFASISNVKTFHNPIDPNLSGS